MNTDGSDGLGCSMVVVVAHKTGEGSCNIACDQAWVKPCVVGWLFKLDFELNHSDLRYSH